MAVFHSKSITYNDQASMRLDRFLLSEFESLGYSRSYWTNMINGGFVEVNGKPSVKAGQTMAAGDVVAITWPKVDRTYKGTVDTIFKDERVVVVNKPAGMLTHSKGVFNPEHTIADEVRPYVSFPREEDPNSRAGIVHRLDRFTSGVLVTARTPESLAFLQKQFKDRSVSKYYVAILDGCVDNLPDTIDVPLDRNPANPRIRSATPDGKQAITNIVASFVNSKTNTTAVLLKPLTGRTHQLRAHLAHIGRPIRGDVSYGALDSGERSLLHAVCLKIRPSNQDGIREFFAPIAKDMSSYIEDEDQETITQLCKQHEA